MKRRKHHRKLKTTGDKYPIYSIESGYAYLLNQIGERAKRDLEMYNKNLRYIGDGRYNQIEKHKINPVKEWNNSYLKQAIETFKYVMNSNNIFECNLILSEAKKSIKEIKFEKQNVGRKPVDISQCIRYRPRWKKYIIAIYRNGSKVTIGRYKTIEEAEDVYDKTIGKTLSEIVDTGLTNIAVL